MDTQDITIRDSMYLQVKTDLRDIQISLDDTLLPSWPPSSSFTGLLPHLNEISILWMGIPSKARIASAAKILIKLLEQVQEVRILKALKNMLDNSKDIVLSTPTQPRYLRRQTEIKQAIEVVLKLLEQPEILHDLKALRELFGLLTNPEAVIDVIKRLEEIEDILAASSWIEWLVNTENIENSYLSLYTTHHSRKGVGKR